LIAAAEHSPQVITRWGRDVAVVLSAADYEGLSGRKLRPLVDFLSQRGLPELELPVRDRDDYVREVDL